MGSHIAVAGRPARIQDVYPSYSSKLLEAFFEDYLGEAVAYLKRTGREGYDFANSFARNALDSADLERMREGKVVAMSLYFKAPNFWKRKCQPKSDSLGSIPFEELTSREHAMWEGTERHGRTFLENYLYPVLDSDFGDWVPVVFLAKDLEVLEPTLRERGWLIVKMNHSSIAECPGAMWRFLACNLPCRSAYIQDTDRPFNLSSVEGMHRNFERNPKTALIRRLQWTGQGSREMTLILGNDFMVRPSHIDFDAEKMMLGYIALNILHEDRFTNLVHEPSRGRDDSRISGISERQKRDHIGPEPHERAFCKNFPYYAFDEQWLKEFAYYHLSDGRIATLLSGHERDNDVYQALDLRHQRERGNILISSEDEKMASAAR